MDAAENGAEMARCVRARPCRSGLLVWWGEFRIQAGFGPAAPLPMERTCVYLPVHFAEGLAPAICKQCPSGYTPRASCVETSGPMQGWLAWLLSDHAACKSRWSKAFGLTAYRRTPSQHNDPLPDCMPDGQCATGINTWAPKVCQTVCPSNSKLLNAGCVPGASRSAAGHAACLPPLLCVCLPYPCFLRASLLLLAPGRLHSIAAAVLLRFCAQP